MVSADEIKEPGSRKSLGADPECLDGIGCSTAFEFLKIDLHPGFTRQRQTKQPDPIGGWRGSGVRFKWRLRGRDEEETFERQLFARGLGDEQMATMDRVERSAV